MTEERVYSISFFGVGESGCDFRTTSHPFKINFDLHAFIRVITNNPINLSPYSFMLLCDTMFKDPNASFLIGIYKFLLFKV